MPRKVKPKASHLTWTAVDYPAAIDVHPHNIGEVVGETNTWYIVKLDAPITHACHEVTKQCVSVFIDKIYLEKDKALVVEG
jgi:hypothetical protein